MCSRSIGSPRHDSRSSSPETALAGLPERAAHALDALKRLGMTIVLDDFGEGYSSINRLGRLPFDTLKVDLSLTGLPSARHAKRILQAMIRLAHSLGARSWPNASRTTRPGTN